MKINKFAVRHHGSPELAEAIAAKLDSWGLPFQDGGTGVAFVRYYGPWTKRVSGYFTLGNRNEVTGTLDADNVGGCTEISAHKLLAMDACPPEIATFPEVTHTIDGKEVSESTIRAALKAQWDGGDDA